MAYITKTQLLNYLQIDTNAFIDAGFSDWLSAIQAFIEKLTGKTFEQVTAEARYFDGNGKRTLYLSQEDDLISVTELLILESDGTTLKSLTEGHANDYLLYPLNTAPKFEIRLVTSASVGAFYKGDRKVKITGNWGNASSVPEDIKLAATIMISQIVKQGLEGGNVKSTKLGDYAVSYGDIESIATKSGAMDILNNYMDFTP